MRRRQMFAAQTVAMTVPVADTFAPPPFIASAPRQTEAKPSDIMMLSEASDGPPPCPKCGKPLGVRGRHFHIRRCEG